jgi:hypothetical protein
MSGGRIVGLVVALAAIVAGVAFAVSAFEDQAPPTTTSGAIGASSVADAVWSL